MAFKHTVKTQAIMVAFLARYAECEEVSAIDLIPAIVEGRKVTVSLRDIMADLRLRKMEALGSLAWLEQGEQIYQVRNSKREVVALVPFSLAAAFTAIDSL